MTKDTTILIVSAAALTRDDGRVLVQRRPPAGTMAGLWEFPGGKVEPGETPEAALVRELAEELGIAVPVSALAPLSFGTGALAEDRSLLLLLFACRRWSGEPRALHATELRWATPGELADLPMPAADVPLVGTLARGLAALG